MIFRLLNDSYYIVISLFLIIIGAITSGLTVAVLAVDRLDFEVYKGRIGKNNNSDIEIFEYILKNVHMIVISLLLANSIVLEALPLILCIFTNELIAILISVFVVLIFGEILPQSLFIGKFQIQIIRFFFPAIKLIVLTTCFVSYPLSILLNYFIGDRNSLERYNDKYLSAVLNLYKANLQKELDSKNIFSEPKDECKKIESVLRMLEFRNLCVNSVMDKIEEIHVFNIESMITNDLRLHIYYNNLEYILIYDKIKSNIVGILDTKKLACFNQAKTLYIKDLIEIHNLCFCSSNTCISDLFDNFKQNVGIVFVIDELKLDNVLADVYCLTVHPNNKSLNYSDQIHPQNAVRFKILGIIQQNKIVKELFKLFG